MIQRSPQSSSKRSPEEFLQGKHHDHGQMFRAKMVAPGGTPEYGEWFGTEADLRLSLQGKLRDLGKRYYCETILIVCPECNSDAPAKVIATL